MVMFYAITERLPRYPPRQAGAWIAAMWQAASGQLRWRLVAVTVMLAAHVGLIAEASDGGGLRMSDWVSPQTFISALSAAVAVGVLFQDVAALKKRVAHADEMFARKAEVDLQFASIQMQLKAIHDDLAKNETGKRLAEFVTRFEAYLQTVQSWSNRIEGEIHAVQLDITRIEARSGAKWPTA